MSTIQIFIRHRHLIWQMIRREVVGRYKGSLLGVGWSLVNPIFMLLIYTFVFSEVFVLRWGELDAPESKSQFALLLFAGMIVFTLFAEVLNGAPTLIVSNINYVKRVVFPLEILPLVSLGAALFQTYISLSVLVVALFFVNGYLQWTVILIPLVLLPLVFLTLGLAWLLASLGVFLRDIRQTIGVVTSMLMFLAPVFYPMTAVPLKFRPYIMANPLTFIIEQSREVLIWGHTPDWIGLGIYTGGALVVAWGGFAWFQKTRKGFADVL